MDLLWISWDACWIKELLTEIRSHDLVIREAVQEEFIRFAIIPRSASTSTVKLCPHPEQASVGSFLSRLSVSSILRLHFGHWRGNGRSSSIDELGLFRPAGLGCFGRDLRTLLRSQGSSTSRSAFEPTKPSQGDSGGILGLQSRGFRLWAFADGLKENLMSELVRVTGSFAGAVRHYATSMAGRIQESRA